MTLYSNLLKILPRPQYSKTLFYDTTIQYKNSFALLGKMSYLTIYVIMRNSMDMTTILASKSQLVMAKQLRKMLALQALLKLKQLTICCLVISTHNVNQCGCCSILSYVFHTRYQKPSCIYCTVSYSICNLLLRCYYAIYEIFSKLA